MGSTAIFFAVVPAFGTKRSFHLFLSGPAFYVGLFPDTTWSLVPRQVCPPASQNSSALSAPNSSSLDRLLVQGIRVVDEFYWNVYLIEPPKGTFDWAFYIVSMLLGILVVPLVVGRLCYSDEQAVTGNTGVTNQRQAGKGPPFHRQPLPRFRPSLCCN